jgi:hypothetical protein
MIMREERDLQMRGVRKSRGERVERDERNNERNERDMIMRNERDEE